MEKEEIETLLREHLEELKAIMKEISDCRSNLYWTVSDEINEKRAALQRVQTRLQEEILELEVAAQQRNSALHTQIDLLAAREAECRSEISRIGKLLSPEEGQDGLKIEQEGGWKISVSKVKPSVEYKAEELIKAMPQFASAKVDGDPLFKRTVNKDVLNRLLASGEVEEEAVEPYRVITAERKPTVRIIVGEVNE